MKIIVRTLIILVAALIVVAAAVDFAQSSFAVALAPNMPAEQRGEAPVFVTDAETAASDAAGSSVTFSTAATGTTATGTTATGTGEAPLFAGEGSRPDHGEAGGIQGALPIAKNFAIMALLVGVVALGSQGLARLRQSRMQLQVR